MSTAFNISKHMIGYYFDQARNGTNTGIICILLQSSGLEADATLADYDDCAALIAGSSNEAGFTNYVRKTIAGTSGAGVPAPTIDDANNRILLDLPDQTWASAGGAVNQTLGAILLAFDPNTTTGTDSTLVPLLKLDFTATTDGNDLTVRFNVDGAARVN